MSAPTPPRSKTASTPPDRFVRRDDVATSALEFSILGPILLLLIFGIIYGALDVYARDVAGSAAREGVSYLRLAGNNSDPNAFMVGAQRTAIGFATEVGHLKHVSAQTCIDPAGGRVQVTVSGQIVFPIGGVSQISETATATLEQFRGDVRGTQAGTTGGPACSSS